MSKNSWYLCFIACLVLLGCKGVNQIPFKQFTNHDLWLSDTGAIIRYDKEQPVLFYRNFRYPIEIKSDQELSFSGQDQDVYNARYITNGISMTIDVTTEEGPFIRYIKTQQLNFINYHQDVSAIATDSVVIVRENKEDIRVHFDGENPLNAELRKDLFTICHQYYHNYRPNRDGEIRLNIYDDGQGSIKRYTGIVPNTLEFPYRYITTW